MNAKYYIYILVIFHLIGFTLFQIDSSNASLSYVNLSLCALLLFLSEQKKPSSVYIFLMLFIGGWTLEFIGVHTGTLFGDYQYGDGLGIKIYGIPLIMGVNWYAIVLSSSAVAQKVKTRPINQAFIAAALCTLMDLVIEPVAIQFDFWSWDNGTIPLFNYLCWFVFSFVFALVYITSNKQRNITALWLYPIWLLFFTALNLAA